MSRLGQHFLKNKTAIKKIISALELKNGETIIEIGPGHGELTLPLADACQKLNSKIIAIEKDVQLADDLKNKIRDLGIIGVEILAGDALKILKSYTAPNEPYKIAGNIPYYLTGHLLRTIGEMENKPEICVFTLQKEVAERIVAEPPKMNRLAASVRFWAQAKVIAHVPKEDFEPAPKVDSAIIILLVESKNSGVESLEYYKTMKIIFAQPRKTVLNNLSDGFNLPKEKIMEKLIAIKVSPQDRPQNLSVKDIAKIAGIF